MRCGRSNIPRYTWPNDLLTMEMDNPARSPEPTNMSEMSNGFFFIFSDDPMNRVSEFQNSSFTFLVLTDFVVACDFRQSRSCNASLGDSLPWDGRDNPHKPRMDADEPRHRPSAFIRVHLRITIPSPCRRPQKPLESVTFNPEMLA